MDLFLKLCWMIPTAISVLLFFLYVGRHFEKKNFNNGICKCGGHFKPFDFRVFIGSDGSRGYSCDKCNKSIFCSYNVDKGYEYKPS